MPRKKSMGSLTALVVLAAAAWGYSRWEESKGAAALIWVGGLVLAGLLSVPSPKAKPVAKRRPRKRRPKRPLLGKDPRSLKTAERRELAKQSLLQRLDDWEDEGDVELVEWSSANDKFCCKRCRERDGRRVTIAQARKDVEGKLCDHADPEGDCCRCALLAL